MKSKFSVNRKSGTSSTTNRILSGLGASTLLISSLANNNCSQAGIFDFLNRMWESFYSWFYWKEKNESTEQQDKKNENYNLLKSDSKKSVSQEVVYRENSIAIDNEKIELENKKQKIIGKIKLDLEKFNKNSQIFYENLDSLRDKLGEDYTKMVDIFGKYKAVFDEENMEVRFERQDGVAESFNRPIRKFERKIVASDLESCANEVSKALKRLEIFEKKQVESFCLFLEKARNIIDKSKKVFGKDVFKIESSSNEQLSLSFLVNNKTSIVSKIDFSVKIYQPIRSSKINWDGFDEEKFNKYLKNCDISLNFIENKSKSISKNQEGYFLDLDGNVIFYKSNIEGISLQGQEGILKEYQSFKARDDVLSTIIKGNNFSFCRIHKFLEIQDEKNFEFANFCFSVDDFINRMKEKYPGINFSVTRRSIDDIDRVRIVMSDPDNKVTSYSEVMRDSNLETSLFNFEKKVIPDFFGQCRWMKIENEVLEKAKKELAEGIETFKARFSKKNGKDIYDDVNFKFKIEKLENQETVFFIYWFIHVGEKNGTFRLSNKDILRELKESGKDITVENSINLLKEKIQKNFTSDEYLAKFDSYLNNYI